MMTVLFTSLMMMLIVVSHAAGLEEANPKPVGVEYPTKRCPKSDLWWVTATGTDDCATCSAHHRGKESNSCRSVSRPIVEFVDKINKQVTGKFDKSKTYTLGSSHVVLEIGSHGATFHVYKLLDGQLEGGCGTYEEELYLDNDYNACTLTKDDANTNGCKKNERATRPDCFDFYKMRMSFGQLIEYVDTNGNGQYDVPVIVLDTAGNVVRDKDGNVQYEPVDELLKTYASSKTVDSFEVNGDIVTYTYDISLAESAALNPSLTIPTITLAYHANTARKSDTKVKPNSVKVDVTITGVPRTKVGALLALEGHLDAKAGVVSTANTKKNKNEEGEAGMGRDEEKIEFMQADTKNFFQWETQFDYTEKINGEDIVSIREINTKIVELETGRRMQQDGSEGGHTVGTRRGLKKEEQSTAVWWTFLCPEPDTKETEYGDIFWDPSAGVGSDVGKDCQSSDECEVGFTCSNGKAGRTRRLGGARGRRGLLFMQDKDGEEESGTCEEQR